MRAGRKLRIELVPASLYQVTTTRRSTSSMPDTGCNTSESLRNVEAGSRNMESPREEASEVPHPKQKMSPLGHLFRFVAPWFGFSSLYAMGSVCPCCGQQGCPVGLASAGAVGAFFALCVQDWKRFFRFLKHKPSKHEDIECSH
jgi:hypothetical protein